MSHVVTKTALFKKMTSFEFFKFKKNKINKLYQAHQSLSIKNIQIKCKLKLFIDTRIDTTKKFN